MSFIRLPFDEVISDESGGNIKTPQSEYLVTGSYPVVDQGKELIAGYVDGSERICGSGKSAIVFGDHTRCIKYVDFPFCMGADGVKVLRAKIDADLKYLYYYLKSLDIPNAGYSRHFKYLKRTEIVLPSLPEQRRIAAILDQADALRAKRREALAQLDSLTQSIFIEMFGDPKVNPKQWPNRTLDELTEKITDGEHLNPEFSLTGMPIVMAGNVLEQAIDFSLAKKVELALGEKFRKKCNPERGDLLIVSRGATIGRMCPVDTDEVFCLMGSAILIKLKKDKINTAFVTALLKHPMMRRELYKTSGSSAQQAIYLKDLKNLRCITPPIELQREFSQHVSEIDKARSPYMQSLVELNALFASLQHRAFQGEL